MRTMSLPAATERTAICSVEPVARAAAASMLSVITTPPKRSCSRNRVVRIAWDWLAIRCEFLVRDILLKAAPDVFHLTDHYRDYPAILVDLKKIKKAALLDILEQGWRMSASKKLLREYDER